MLKLDFDGETAINNMFSHFDYLQTGRVGLENIDHAAFEEWLQIMDAEAGTLGTLPTGAGTSNPFEDVVAKSVVPVNLAPNQQRLKKRMLGPCTDYASFCAALEAKYGNKIRAWASMGWHADEKISRKAFAEQLCKSEGIVRDPTRVKELWRGATVDNSGFWSLTKFAPEEVRVLNAL
jgi:hypothetical protein